MLDINWDSATQRHGTEEQCLRLPSGVNTDTYTHEIPANKF